MRCLQGLKIQDNHQESLNLHRDITNSMTNMGFQRQQIQDAELAEDLPLFPEPPGSDGYLGDPALLGKL